MQPFDGVTPDTAVALAEPGQIYVIYLPHGGEVTVDLSAASGTLAVRWLNPRTGVATDCGTTRGTANCTLRAPFNGDAVLHCVRMAASKPRQPSSSQLSSLPKTQELKQAVPESKGRVTPCAGI
jgi:hypothetical protein